MNGLNRLGSCIFCGASTQGIDLSIAGKIISLPPAECCGSQDCISRRDQEESKKRADEMLQHLISQVPPIIRETHLPGLPSDKARSLSSWMPTDEKRHLFICGGVRSGKTRSMFLAASGIARATSHPITWVDSFRLEEAFTGFGAGNADLSRIRTARLLALDDLGKERLSEKIATGIFKILDYRTSYALTTLITSNFTPSALSDRFHDETLGTAIRGRINDFFDRYLLENKS